MKKRTIGGVSFVILFYFTLVVNPLFYLLMTVFLVAGIYELCKIYKKTNAKMQTILYSIAFILFILSMSYLSMVAIPVVMYLTLLLMMDDTLAYLVGKSIGKHKLSKISPNKTIEGSLGGLILSPFVAILIMTLLQYLLAGFSIQFITFDFATLSEYNPFSSLPSLIVVSFILALLGQIGDLTESWFKRSAEIKDSGKIVYGHGGILDRIDSWIFPTIIMATIMLFI